MLRGAVYDVAVDLRKGSPTFGQWVGETLSGENKLAMWVPTGFAHGFIPLEDRTLVYYKSTAHYVPEAERALAYDDPTVGVEWPMEPAIIAEKDTVAPRLADAEYNFPYEG